jgi:hypothetical protein
MRARVVPVLLALSCLAFAPAPLPRRDAPVGYQKMAEAALWLPPERNELERSLGRDLGGYRIDDVDANGRWPVLVQIRDGKAEVCSFVAHSGTAFLIRRGVLYRAEFDRHSSGCAIVAHDLKARKRLWRAELKGLGPVDHSKYFNAVRLEPVDGKVLAVHGKESAGRYVELVALRSGKTVGHKVVPE